MKTEKQLASITIGFKSRVSYNEIKHFQELIFDSTYHNHYVTAKYRVRIINGSNKGLYKTKADLFGGSYAGNGMMAHNTYIDYDFDSEEQANLFEEVINDNR